jgi:DNA-binding FrmR family transcriptional regulator
MSRRPDGSCAACATGDDDADVGVDAAAGVSVDAAPRKARAVDDKAGLITRLKRIEGQVRGVQQMIDDERYCPDVLAQIAAIESALRGVSRAVVKNHLRHCASHALRSDDEAERERMVQELVDILGR